MDNSIIKVADTFWNIRGSFKLGGRIDIGTQASLVKLATGNFVFLDAYAFDADQQETINSIIGGARVEAILNVHPFHTVNVERMHELYPHAKLYGTARHCNRFPHLPWESDYTEHDALHEKYRDDLQFSVPRGVEFISDNENVHFSSVLVFHPESGAIHVDDTFGYAELPGWLPGLGAKGLVSLHPTLPLALEKRAGAAREFREWAQTLFSDWGAATTLCAAHSALLQVEAGEPSLQTRLKRALMVNEPILRAHQMLYGK